MYKVLTVRLFGLKLKDSSELPKCKCPKNGTLVFTLIKKTGHQNCFLTKRSFLVEVNFNSALISKQPFICR